MRFTVLAVAGLCLQVLEIKVFANSGFKLLSVQFLGFRVQCSRSYRFWLVGCNAIMTTFYSHASTRT